MSTLLSGSYLGISSLVFYGTQHGVKTPCGLVHDRAGFFEHNIFVPEMGKTGQV